MINLLKIGCRNNKVFCNYFKNVYNVRNTVFSRKINLDAKTNVVKDVILYKYENQKFFTILNIFALCQYGFWSYLSIFAYATLRDAPTDKTDENQKWWRRINLGENKYRYSLTAVFFLIGCGILVTSWTYTLRSVRYLILRKGGQEVTFVTYSPLGSNRFITVDLKNVSAHEAREFAKVQLPIKIKNKSFFYLLDMRGEFLNPKLFDQTVGLKRVWKN